MALPSLAEHTCHDRRRMEHAFREVLSVDVLAMLSLSLVGGRFVGDCVETPLLQPSSGIGGRNTSAGAVPLVKKTAFLNEFTGSAHVMAASLRNAKPSVYAGEHERGARRRS